LLCSFLSFLISCLILFWFSVLLID
jgi:hypothetical protein